MAQGSAFQNGSFESGTVCFCGMADNDTRITGWVHNTGNPAGFDEFNISGDNGATAFDGTNFVSFGHSGTTDGSLSQTFDTVAGTTYVVGYFREVIQGFGPDNNPPQTVNLSAFDASNSSQLASADDMFVNEDWLSGSLSFIAGSSSSTIVFMDATSVTNSGPVNWALDNVTVTAQTAGSATPEPGTFSLMGGVLLAGFAMFRRRR